jgi:hypothetical protein
MRIGSKENDLDRAQFRCRARFRAVRRRSVPMIRWNQQFTNCAWNSLASLQCERFFFVSPRPCIWPRHKPSRRASAAASRVRSQGRTAIAKTRTPPGIPKGGSRDPSFGWENQGLGTRAPLRQLMGRAPEIPPGSVGDLYSTRRRRLTAPGRGAFLNRSRSRSSVTSMRTRRPFTVSSRTSGGSGHTTVNDPDTISPVATRNL